MSGDLLLTGSGQTGRAMENEVRKYRAFQYRLKGWSYRRIAVSLRCDVKTVSYYINSTLDEISLATVQNAESLRQMEIERCDMAAVALYPLVKQGDLKAVALWHQNIELRAKLLQLFRPKAVINVNVDYNTLSDDQLERLSRGESL